MHDLHFVPIQIFRETPDVTFFDAGVIGSNGTDVVVHEGPAISPPDDGDFPQFYVHHHQIDHNLVISGSRCFELLNPAWDRPHHMVYLERNMGALRIPIGTYHRSVSGARGSLVLNQSVRDGQFSYATEFIPVSLRDRADLRAAREQRPWVWSLRNGHLCHDHPSEAPVAVGR
ncbi:hemagglutinin [Synechococcus sp. RSCCF101]|uniref:hemagglutinin n=1 Tax=Synechococcus sp. RSCCF101 TaxID=2511069 RepID=UPI001244C5AD|nr:hemagglutinin [Synechococcus sp. RSCCF101]QEY31074.1 hemagglutinin [Synechococcus sp. RSCCF101]